VRWRYDIDIVTTDFLKLKHHPSQFIDLSFGPHAMLAYFPVLTEHTPQIAVGNKDGPRATSPHKWPFFTEMRMKGRNNKCYARGLAEPAHSFKTIHTALSWTEPATLRNGPQLLCSPPQFTCSMQFQISGFKARAYMPRFFNYSRWFTGSRF
jgi:hypothetical protein